MWVDAWAAAQRMEQPSPSEPAACQTEMEAGGKKTLKHMISDAWF